MPGMVAVGCRIGIGNGIGIGISVVWDSAIVCVIDVDIGKQGCAVDRFDNKYHQKSQQIRRRMLCGQATLFPEIFAHKPGAKVGSIDVVATQHSRHT